MSNVNFKNSSFEFIQLNNSTIKDCKFENTNITLADFSNTEFYNVNFKNMNYSLGFNNICDVNKFVNCTLTSKMKTRIKYNCSEKLVEKEKKSSITSSGGVNNVVIQSSTSKANKILKFGNQ